MVILCILGFGCEDVVDVDLDQSNPKLVVDAKLTRDVATANSNVYVRLTTTAPFFDNVIPSVNDAMVTIGSDQGTFPLTHTENGLYTAEIEIVNNTEYTLTIIYNGETYSASETLVEVATLEFVEQNDEGGFTGDAIELKAFFMDPAGIENYYFFEGLSERGDVYDTFFDEFFDGNSIFGFYSVEDLEAGDQVNFFLSGVNEQFYNFMFVLLQQGSDTSGGPFETQPATVRGNILNTTNPNNFPLGYFRVSEVSTLSYTVK